MKLLYITFIDLDNSPTSGSSVRPIKLKQAFEQLGIEIYTVSGQSNIISVRRNAVKKAQDKLEIWHPDACYIEPPSGPMFYQGDLNLIKLLHKKRIPISIFYRDAYWKYPEYYLTRNTPFKERIKHKVVKIMQRYQWNVFNKNIDIIYFPSMTMAKEFECAHMDTLPPGAFIPNANDKQELSVPLQFIFVGGAAKNHGTFLTIEAFDKVNQGDVKAKVFYICPEEQWKRLGIDKEKYKAWLEVIHASGDEQLKKYYERADVALLTAPRTFYRDFAVPIKIFEYISYLKPVLVTNCTETAKIVEENHAGWVCTDSVEEVAAKIQFLVEHPEEVKKVKAGINEAREKNLWISRAEKVLNDLEGVMGMRITCLR